MDFVDLFLSLNGRLRRSTYLLGQLILLLLTAVAFVLDLWRGSSQLDGMGEISIIFSLLALYPSIALYTKRWHDRNKSGWWSLLVLVPIIGPIWMFIELGFLGGTIGPNRFGPDPRY